MDSSLHVHCCTHHGCFDQQIRKKKYQIILSTEKSPIQKKILRMNLILFSGNYCCDLCYIHYYTM